MENPDSWNTIESRSVWLQVMIFTFDLMKYFTNSLSPLRLWNSQIIFLQKNWSTWISKSLFSCVDHTVSMSCFVSASVNGEIVTKIPPVRFISSSTVMGSGSVPNHFITDTCRNLFATSVTSSHRTFNHVSPSSGAFIIVLYLSKYHMVCGMIIHLIAKCKRDVVIISNFEMLWKNKELLMSLDFFCFAVRRCL